MTDLSGALAARRVGSVGVLAGTQLTSLAVLLVIAAANRTLLDPGTLPGVAMGLFLGTFAAVAYLSFYAATTGDTTLIGPIRRAA